LNTSCKTEVVGALFHNYIKKHGVSFEAGRELLDKLKGRATFAMTALVYDGEQTHMISLKDSTGFEPMCFGSIDNAFVVASESCSHRRLGSYSDREYLGGEMTICNSSGVDTQRLRNDPQLSDIFQGVYFGNPGSLFQDKEIYQIRRQLGLQLVDLYKTSKADIVIPNPDSGWGVTMGIAEGLGKNVYPALIKLAQAVRTFQEMEKVQRFREVGLKFGGIDSLLTGTNIAMGDDSIVKGSVGEGGSIAVLLNAEIKSLEFWVSYAPMMFPSFKEWHHKKTSLDILAVQRAFNGDTPYDKTHEEINEAVARLIVSRMNEIKPGDYDIEVKYNTLERIKKVTGKGSFQALDPKTYPIDEKFWPTWLKEEVEKFEKLRVH